MVPQLLQYDCEREGVGKGIGAFSFANETASFDDNAEPSVRLDKITYEEGLEILDRCLIEKVIEVKPVNKDDLISTFQTLWNVSPKPEIELINIMEPLKCGRKVFIEEVNEEVSIVIQYERLLDFCFHYGKLGHQHKKCVDFDGDVFNSSTAKWRFGRDGGRGDRGRRDRWFNLDENVILTDIMEAITLFEHNMETEGDPMTAISKQQNLTSDIPQRFESREGFFEDQLGMTHPTSSAPRSLPANSDLFISSSLVTHSIAPSTSFIDVNLADVVIESICQAKTNMEITVSSQPNVAPPFIQGSSP
ncbi:hypothetical protein Sjap_013559 [Stephania japonica]|uniref:Zinc knuckle CX2CX4HX4C domain-containing protein n=1 Tax=Stephania japonica TaxID=461633 RepID=A0AAP0IY06_9MAGN